MVNTGDLLRCDVCHHPIEQLSAAWVLWSADSSLRVTELAIVHAGQCASNVNHLAMSTCLDSLADPRAAVAQLAEWHTNYTWGSAHGRRLSLLAWAATSVATRAEQTASKRWAAFKETALR